MTKFLLLDVSSQTNHKTSEQFYILKAFGDIQKYGKISKEAISIRLNGINDYNKYKDQIGKTV